MNHAAVVPGLVTGDGRFFFQNDDANAGLPSDQLKSCGETYDTTADNGEIKIQIHALGFQLGPDPKVSS